MIIKHSTTERDLVAFDRLLASEEFARLPASSRRKAVAQVRGLRGEKYVAFILNRHFHDSENHAVIHDLRLPDGIGGYAQFDHIILSRLSRTATVIEVKNYAGRLSKNSHDEWMVWYNGRRRPVDIPNPLKQAGRQREVLRAWFRDNQHDLAFETIGTFVVVPPDCTIDRKAVTEADRVYKADNLYDAWVEFGGISGWGKLFSAGISADALLSVAKTLCDAHRPIDLSPRQLLGLESIASVAGEHLQAATRDTLPGNTW